MKKGRITRWRPRWRIALVLLLIAYIPFAATGCGADRLVLGENHETVGPTAATPRTMNVDGRTVEYWVTGSPGARGREPQAIVLYFTGKGSRAEQWIDVVAGSWGDRPIEMWAMNYPGSGGSAGPASLARVGPDAVAVYDAAKIEAGGRPIFIEGGSFGTAAALHVAARRPVAGLVLKNPPPLRELILGNYGWWNLWLLAGPIARAIPDDLDSIANARRSTAPAVFLSAGSDTKVPPRYHRMVIDAYAGPHQVITAPKNGHDDGLPRDLANEWNLALDHLWTGAGLPPPQGNPK
jgi:pimeloyl-ACP methyl ester carboxylesterase